MDGHTGRVLIIGAGPTGLTLALLLARAGIRSTLIERHSAPQPHPAACILGTRTMEVFRVIGLAETILRDCQNIFDRGNITWVTTLAGIELGRCSALADDVPAQLALSPVHGTQFPQNRLEPLLWQAVRNQELVDFRPGSSFVGYREGPDDIEAVVDGPDGAMTKVAGAYLVACDGATSHAREKAGLAMEGRDLQHMIGVYFTADLQDLVGWRKSILYWTLNPNAFGVLIAHWLPLEWVLFVPYYPPQQSPGDFSPERCEGLVEAAIGVRPPDLAIRLIRPWDLSAKLASAYRNGRIFLAGDAAHVFPPTGGLGLNTGVQDAHNLAWKLAAVLKGAAGPALLETYEEERRPVARANLDHSVRNYENMSDLLQVVGLDLKQQDRLRKLQDSGFFRLIPRRWQNRIVEGALRLALRRLRRFSARDGHGAAARKEFVRRIPDQSSHYRFAGLDLGFTYERGAFVPEPTPKPLPADPIADYLPTTWPSARLPHLWLSSGDRRLSVHDLLLPDQLLLLTDPPGKNAWTRAVAAMDASPMPVTCLAIAPASGGGDLHDRDGDWPRISEVGEGGAVLVRPDGHVAWRTRRLADVPPDRIAAVLEDVLRMR